MLVQPTVDAASSFMAERVSPMLEETPRLAGKIKSDDDDKAKKKTALIKEFAGGYIVGVGANSATSLASRAIKTLLMDEVDRFPVSASGGEGSPRLLAERRTQSFLHVRKIVAVSTPTVKGESEIDKLYEQGSQETYHVKCPHCGDSHVMLFDHLKWTEDKPETAAYVAPCCGTVWNDADRHEATLHGEWVAANPAALPEHRSFHADALVSPFHTHESMASEIETAKGDPMAERTLENTMRALSYSDETALLTEESITGRIESFGLSDIPEEVLVIACGIDVQRDRLEAVFVGYGEDNVSYILGHLIVYGSPFDGSTWDQLSEAVDRPFEHPYGGEIFIDSIAVDSGYATKEVVQWTAQRTNRFAIKGVPGNDKPRWSLSKGKKSHAAQMQESLHLVGTFQGKESLLLSMQKPVGEPGSVRIGDIEAFVDRDEFARQITAEYRRQTPQKNGSIKVEWIRKAGRRSEILDCVVYADSAFHGGIKHLVNWEARRENLTYRPEPEPEPVVVAQGQGGQQYQQPTTSNGSAADPNSWASFG
jgi:phage terminase large subunit GpA-like protein